MDHEHVRGLLESLLPDGTRLGDATRPRLLTNAALLRVMQQWVALEGHPNRDAERACLLPEIEHLGGTQASIEAYLREHGLGGT